MSGPNVPSFSEPWDFSDLIIVVESEKLHVHKSILAMCSPVFKRMLSADFKEKMTSEIQLPGKTVEQVREMLLLMYPFPTAVTESTNVASLLALGREYQMHQLTCRVEDALLRRQTSVDLLLLAQEYELKKLLDKCTCTLSRSNFSDIKQHSRYGEIDAEHLSTILQGHIRFLKEQHDRDMRNTRENFRKFKSDLTGIVAEINECWGYNKLPIRGCICNSYTKSCLECNSVLEKFIKVKCGELLERIERDSS